MIHRVKKGSYYGAFFGGMLGLAPGVLLVIVASDGDQDVTGGEIVSFWIFSILLLAAAGAIVGSACGAAVEATSKRVRRSTPLYPAHTLSTTAQQVAGSDGSIRVTMGASAGDLLSGSSQLPEDMVRRGDALDLAGQHEGALACYDQALAADDTSSNAWYSKAWVLLGLGRNREALECCDRALEHDPGNGEAWYTSASALSSIGRFSEAETRFQRALDCFDEILASESGNSEAWRAKGTVLANMDRCDEAIACFDRALAVDPQNPESWYQKGLAVVRLPDPVEGTRRIHEALLYFDRASQLGHNKAAEAAAHYRWLQIAP